MKNKAAVLMLMISFVLAFNSYGQGIENDDMYFNSKDRAKLKELKAQTAYASASSTSKKKMLEEDVNPTDSYSARNVNPEYAARSNAQDAQAEENYFVPDYRYATANNFNSWNNNFNRWYRNPWYMGGWYGMGAGAWNPYYGGFYDPFYSPWNAWNDPFWGYGYNGWSSSFYWGTGWGNYGYWNSPMMWGPGWGWNSMYAGGWGRGWYGYPRNVVIVNNYNDHGGRRVVYGKRPERGTLMNNEVNNTTRMRSSQYTTNSGTNNSSGRVSDRRQEEYYNRSWRYSTPNTNDQNSSWNNSRSNSNYTQQRSNNSNNWSNPSPSYNNSSRGSYNTGAPTRTQAPSSGGSGGRTRGRD